MKRRRYLLLVAQLLTIAAALVSISVIRYVLTNPGNSVQQNVASWARNNGLGGVVDTLESWLHDEPPSTAPADSLSLIDTGDQDTTTTVAGGPTPSTITSGTVAPGTVAPGTTIPLQPPSLPVAISPALEGEGVFRPVTAVRGRTVIWATSMRPLSDFGSVVATVVVWDPTRFRTALFNGTETPGGTGWVNGKQVMKAARPALVATFNGGFRFEHKPGGYLTEGRTVRPLKQGWATFAIDDDGLATIGVLGRDIRNDGTWVSLRQNLPPLIDEGEIVYQKFPWIEWGKDFDNKIYNFRSAACTRTDGSMAFVAVGDVNIDMLARTLKMIGCKVAMELDINGTWPQFSTFTGFGTPQRWGRVVDTRMGNPNRFLNSSTKDFFALFDPKTLPPGIVR